MGDSNNKSTLLPKAIHDAQLNFSSIVGKELDALLKQGCDREYAIQKLLRRIVPTVDKPSLHDVSHIMKQFQMNQEDATRALIVKQELGRLRKRGLNSLEAIEELTSKMQGMNPLQSPSGDKRVVYKPVGSSSLPQYNEEEKEHIEYDELDEEHIEDDEEDEEVPHGGNDNCNGNELCHAHSSVVFNAATCLGHVPKIQPLQSVDSSKSSLKTSASSITSIKAEKRKIHRKRELVLDSVLGIETRKSKRLKTKEDVREKITAKRQREINENDLSCLWKKHIRNPT